MCVRYTLYDTSSAEFKISENMVGKNYNIAPASIVPVVITNDIVKLVRWTFKVPWASNLNILSCLGLLEGMCCPHYQEELDRRPSLHKILKKGELTFCWAIDGGAAIHFKNGLYFKSLSFYKESYTYKVKKREKSIIEEKLDSIML